MARLLLLLCFTLQILPLHVTASPASQPGSATNAATRGFLMGFTSWPYAATSEAVRETYAFIGTNADLITEHLDDGVPWVEALQDAPFPKTFQERIEGRKKNRPPGTKLLLSLTPLNMGRSGLADCAGNGQRPPLPVELNGKPFDDPQLIRAYANYCRRMIEFFQPDFLLTGIESGCTGAERRESFGWCPPENHQRGHRESGRFLSPGGKVPGTPGISRVASDGTPERTR